MVVPAVAEIVREFPSDRSRLMDIVLAVQRRFGYLSEDAMHTIAAGVGMHLAEIQQMVSFYAFLERKPEGRFQIRLSKTPISLINGAREVAYAFEELLGISIGEPTQ